MFIVSKDKKAIINLEQVATMYMAVVIAQKLGRNTANEEDLEAK